MIISGPQHLYITAAQMDVQHVGQSGLLRNQEDQDRFYLPHKVKKPVFDLYTLLGEKETLAPRIFFSGSWK